MADISIHAPNERSDVHYCDANNKHQRFQSTLLMKGATYIVLFLLFIYIFQSTLLMKGATLKQQVSVIVRNVFQSTLLMKGATKIHRHHQSYSKFQSTLLMKGATAKYSILLRCNTRYCAWSYMFRSALREMFRKRA